MLTICFCFRVWGTLFKSENLGDTGRSPNILAQIGGGRIVGMHPVLGAHAMAVVWTLHLLRGKSRLYKEEAGNQLPQPQTPTITTILHTPTPPQIHNWKCRFRIIPHANR